MIVYKKSEYGWFISIPNEENEYKTVPGDLIAVLRFALKEGCSWLMLDQDASAILELPFYEW